MRAVVDIGSNSVKYTLAEIRRGVPHVVKKRSWITRLGKGMETSGRVLAAESIAATEKAFREMATELAPYRDGLTIEAVATSAVRDAKNPEEISRRVQEIFGVALRVLTGLEEARLSLAGASAAAQVFYGTRACVFVDVGGASTEVGIVEPSFEAHSFQAGAVRCHERLGLDRIPVRDADWQAAQAGLRAFFPDAEWNRVVAKIPATHTRAVAVGGSLLVAARLAGATVAKGPDGESMGFAARVDELERFNDGFRKLSLNERLAKPGIEPGRADILCAGLLCLTVTLRRLGMTEVFISDWGLRQGLLLQGT